MAWGTERLQRILPLVVSRLFCLRRSVRLFLRAGLCLLPCPSLSTHIAIWRTPEPQGSVSLWTQRLDTTLAGSVGNAIAVTAATGVVDDAAAHSYVAVAAVAPTTNRQTRGPLSSHAGRTKKAKTAHQETAHKGSRERHTQTGSRRRRQRDKKEKKKARTAHAKKGPKSEKQKSKRREEHVKKHKSRTAHEEGAERRE